MFGIYIGKGVVGIGIDGLQGGYGNGSVGRVVGGTKTLTIYNKGLEVGYVFGVTCFGG